MAASAILLVIGGLVAVCDQPDVHKEIEKAVQMQEDAFQKNDVDYIRQHTTTNHVSVTPYLQCYHQADLLKAVPNFKIRSHKVGQVRVIPVTKDVVIASYLFEFTGNFQDKTFPARAQVLSVWVRQDGRWVETSYQQTPLEQPKK